MSNKSNMQAGRGECLVCLLLIVASLAAYRRVVGCDFVNFDDPVYVINNRFVLGGISVEGVVWALTATHIDFWQPLSWISHMLDCQLFGSQAGMHHLTNLLIHTANSILLFSLFKRMTGGLWSSAFVAALFLLHPLHVESVAWVSERMGVLSSFFGLLSMRAYARYTESHELRHYFSVLVFYAFSLMSSPILVTMPFILLLLDYWPLGRMQAGQPGKDKETGSGVGKISVLRLVEEKVAFFVLAGIVCILTFHARGESGSIPSFEALPVEIRLANAVVSYVSYIGKTIWPHNLAVFYPHPGTSPGWLVSGAGMLLVCISVLVMRAGTRRPYLAVGWLWYLGALVPVIGIVQSGSQAMADRYTYVPLIGVFIMVAWGMADLAVRWRCRRLLVSVFAGVVLSALIIRTWSQVGYWRNSITLFERALDVTSDNYLAHLNLGAALAEQGDPSGAINHYEAALSIRPDYAEAHSNLGVVLAGQGKTADAIGHYREALRIKPYYADVYNNLGLIEAGRRNAVEAIDHYSEAIRIKPDHAEAHNNLGIVMAEQGKMADASVHFQKALDIKPYKADFYFNLASALARMGLLDDAIANYRRGLQIRPGDAEARHSLGVVLAIADSANTSKRH